MGAILGNFVQFVNSQSKRSTKDEPLTKNDPLLLISPPRRVWKHNIRHAEDARRSISLRFLQIQNYDQPTYPHFNIMGDTLSHFFPISQALWIPGQVIWSETAGYEALMGPS